MELVAFLIVPSVVAITLAIIFNWDTIKDRWKEKTEKHNPVYEMFDEIITDMENNPDKWRASRFELRRCDWDYSIWMSNRNYADCSLENKDSHRASLSQRKYLRRFYDKKLLEGMGIKN